MKPIIWALLFVVSVKYGITEVLNCLKIFASSKFIIHVHSYKMRRASIRKTIFGCMLKADRYEIVSSNQLWMELTLALCSLHAPWCNCLLEVFKNQHTGMIRSHSEIHVLHIIFNKNASSSIGRTIETCRGRGFLSDLSIKSLEYFPRVNVLTLKSPQWDEDTRQ